MQSFKVSSLCLGLLGVLLPRPCCPAGSQERWFGAVYLLAALSVCLWSWTRAEGDDSCASLAGPPLRLPPDRDAFLHLRHHRDAGGHGQLGEQPSGTAVCSAPRCTAASPGAQGGPRGGRARLGATEPVALLGPQLPSSPVPLGTWGLSWAPCAAAAPKSPPLHPTGVVLLGVVPNTSKTKGAMAWPPAAVHPPIPPRRVFVGSMLVGSRFEGPAATCQGEVCGAVSSPRSSLVQKRHVSESSRSNTCQRGCLGD